MKYSKKEQAEAREMLLKFLRPGSTVYTVLRSVSRSGMMRCIDLYCHAEDGNGRQYMQYLSGWAAALGGDSRNKQGAIRVPGCGMDMGFHLVYNLSVRLFCPEKYDHDAAYSLRHEWI